MQKATEIKKNIIKKELFEREIGLCQKLSKEKNGKCNWGICVSCGVVPLLYKLHKGVLLESEDELKDVRKEIFTEIEI